MRFNEVKNISQLKRYFKESNTSLTIKKLEHFDIIYSYATPIAYIYNDELYTLCGRYFSNTTAYYLCTLKRIATDYVTTRELYTLCRQLGIETGKL